MNLLSIQDALKNASDDQLKSLITSPDSTAPSYLVLSELRRRQEMRAKQAQEPRSTVAEDLTSEENMQAPMGIRSLSTPEPGDEDYPTEENAPGIEAMREGGIVHMAKGEAVEGEGEIPAITFGRNIIRGVGDVAQRMVAPPSDDERRRIAVEGLQSHYGSQSNLPSWFTTGANTRRRAAEYLDYVTQNANNPNFNPQAMWDNPEEYIKNNPIAAPTQPAAPAAAPAAAPSSTAATPPARTEGGSPAAPAQTLLLPPEPPAGGPPASGSAAGGIRALAPSAAPAAAAPSALPTIAQNMERNLALFPGIPQELLDRIKASRTNEGERRSEARRMALVEAGLRIAASRNPSLAGAIGEGAAPAVQSYNQQISQIRQDQNADITRELSIAEADLRRRYMAGQISASELQRQTQMIEIAARERQSLRTEAGANARAGASLSRAERIADLQMRRDAQNATNTAARAQATQTATAVQAAIANPMRRAQATTALRAAANNPRLSPTEDQIEDWITDRVTTRMNNVYEQSRPLATSNAPRTNATVIPGTR